MAEPSTPLQSVRDRLTGLLADWGSELSAILQELEQKRARVEELERKHSGRDEQLKSMQQRLEGQENLIETLQSDAEEAAKLRKELRAKDLEFERLSSELDSKKELIRALRRDAEGVDRLKADSKVKDREIEDLKTHLQRAEQKIEELSNDFDVLREAAAGKASEESAEIEALRAELDARKTMIKSLRADQDRAATLEANLDEKREIIEQLEASLNRHAGTIAELRRSAESWKRKYQALKGESSTAATSVNLPSLSTTDVQALERLEQTTDGKPEATIAIDMRRSLLEARRAAAQTGEK